MPDAVRMAHRNRAGPTSTGAPAVPGRARTIGAPAPPPSPGPGAPAVTDLPSLADVRSSADPPPSTVAPQVEEAEDLEPVDSEPDDPEDGEPDEPEDDEPAAPDAWLGFDHAVRERHGVADSRLAVAHGVSRQRFFDRTRREGWQVARSGIRLHPHSTASVQRRLMVALTATAGLGAASGETAAWLHGLRTYPPDRLSIAIAHAARAKPRDGVLVRRARWLADDVVTDVEGVPTLTVPATLLSCAKSPVDAQRARLIDVLHRRLATAGEVIALLERCGPVPGRGTLRALLEEFGPLVVESIFQDEVVRTLRALGFPAERSTRRIDTPDGVGLTVDIALLAWLVALEPEGDAFHRTREQRRTDRRRVAAYAGTEWALVPIDWRDWFLDREHVLDSILAAIAAQQRRGIGVDVAVPHL
jgi:hypothetical protein